eukprot:1149237-Pelagomonas_calceolata.AAC.5
MSDDALLSQSSSWRFDVRAQQHGLASVSGPGTNQLCYTHTSPGLKNLQPGSVVRATLVLRNQMSIQLGKYLVAGKRNLADLTSFWRVMCLQEKTRKKEQKTRPHALDQVLMSRAPPGKTNKDNRVH